MKFCKMEALGNDFVVFGNPSSTVCPKADLIKRICDRHYGVGADCAVCITSSKVADFEMHVYNPDGFEAEICGNALRCTAKFIAENGYFKRKSYTVSTNAGIRSLKVMGNIITAEIGRPAIIGNGFLEVCGKTFNYYSVSVGNPHCVIFANTLSDELVFFYGKAIEKHPVFPNGTNVEFARILDEDNIEMRVWERGIGETFSCSTGSCAVVAAAQASYRMSDTVNVSQIGGNIVVETHACGNMFISGSCNTVFKGDFPE